MSCPELTRALAALEGPRGGLGREERRRLLDHTAGCAACSRVVAVLAGVRELARRREAPAATPECLDDAALATLLDRTTAPELGGSSMEHVAGCSSCVTRLLDAVELLSALEEEPALDAPAAGDVERDGAARDGVAGGDAERDGAATDGVAGGGPARDDAAGEGGGSAGDDGLPANVVAVDFSGPKGAAPGARPISHSGFLMSRPPSTPRASRGLLVASVATAAAAAIVLVLPLARTDPLVEVIDEASELPGLLVRELDWPEAPLGMVSGSATFSALFLESARLESRRLHAGGLGSTSAEERARARARAAGGLDRMSREPRSPCLGAAVGLGVALARLRASLVAAGAGIAVEHDLPGTPIRDRLSTCTDEELAPDVRARVLELLGASLDGRPAGELEEWARSLVALLSGGRHGALHPPSPPGPLGEGDTRELETGSPRGEGTGGALAVGEADARDLEAELAVAVTLRRLDDLTGAWAALVRALRAAHAVPHADLSLATARLEAARILGALGDVDSAVALTARALELRAARLGPWHPDTAEAMALRALALRHAGRHDEARPLLSEAVALMRDVTGPSSPRTLELLAAHGAELAESGDLAGELEVLDRLVESWRARGHTAEHDLSLSQALLNAGTARLERGRAAEAEVLLSEALAIRTERLGPEHPRTVAARRMSAFAASALGDRARAKRLFAENLAPMLGSYRRRAPLLSGDVAALRALERVRHDANRDLDQVVAWFDAPAEAPAVLEAALAWQGAARALRAGERATPHTAVDVCRALAGRRAALVDYLHTVRVEYPASGGPDEQAEYVALVARGGPCRVSRVLLGSAEVIDAAVGVYQAALADASACGRARPLALCERPVLSLRRAAERVRVLVFDPLAPLLDVERLFVVPDGALVEVGLDGLPDAGGAPLLTRFEVVHLAEPAQLFARTGDGPGDGGSLVIGAIDYGHAPGSAQPGGPAAGRVVAGARGGDPCAFRRSFAPIATREPEDVARWLGAPGRGPLTYLAGREAEEAEVTRLMPGRRLIHVSSHAFVADAAACAAPPLGHPPSARTRPPIYRSDARLSALFPELGDVGSVDPLALPALVLAGANHGLTHARAHGEDAFLTAREVSELALEGTELVTISACDSYGGATLTGEAPLGLARAFLGAGASQVIVALWPVPAEETALLFRELYARLVEGRSVRVASALRAAKLEVQASVLGRTGLPDAQLQFAGFIVLGAGGS